MGSFDIWDRDQPSGDSTLKQSDDQIRSYWSILENALNTESYFTSESASSASAGVPRLGSARPFVGAASSVSTQSDVGRLMWTTDARQLYHVGHGSIDTLPSLGTTNTWLSQQSFAAGIALSALTASGSGFFSGNVKASTFSGPVGHFEDVTAGDIVASSLSAPTITGLSSISISHITTDNLTVGASNGSTVKALLYGMGWIPGVTLTPGTSTTTVVAVTGVAKGDIATCNLESGTDNEVSVTVQAVDANSVKVVIQNIAAAGDATIPSNTTVHVLAFDLT